MSKIDECDMGKFGTLDSSEKTISYPRRYRWWPPKAEQEGDEVSKTFFMCICTSKYIYGKTVVSAQILEVSLLGVGTVLRLERDAWQMVKRLRQATNKDAPPSLTPGRSAL